MSNIPYGKRLAGALKALFHTRKSWVFSNENDITISNDTPTTILTSSLLLIHRYDKLHLTISIPLKEIGDDAICVNLFVWVAGKWYNFGNSGFYSGSDRIVLEKVLDLAGIFNLDYDYTAKIEVVAISQIGDLFINKECDINREVSVTDRPTDITSGSLNFCNMIARAIR